jgi:acetyl-CoA/propionyl-CoA carboxylase biotin carboxyl carrier protein
MVAKLIVHDVDRERARRRMLRALREFEITGVRTLVGFHRALLEHPCFVAGETCHGLVESEELAQRAEELTEDQLAHRTTSVARASDGVLSERATVAEVDGRRVEVRVLVPEPAYRELARQRRARTAAGGAGAGSGAVVSPMQGTVLDVKVADGEVVEVGQVLCIVEAMKMENEVAADRGGTVRQLAVAVGDAVSTGQTICVVEADADADAA